MNEITITLSAVPLMDTVSLDQLYQCLLSTAEFLHAIVHSEASAAETTVLCADIEVGQGE